MAVSSCITHTFRDIVPPIMVIVADCEKSRPRYRVKDTE